MSRRGGQGPAAAAFTIRSQCVTQTMRERSGEASAQFHFYVILIIEGHIAARQE